MESTQSSIDWRALGEDLRAPFAPEAVEWRPQGKGAGTPGARVQVVAYLDARTVQDRLDTVVGPGGWSFALEPVVVNAGELMVARGRLTIHGISKDDIGTASRVEASKGCASDALKRAAVAWGIGRYLYELPAVWIQLDDKGHIGAGTLADLRAALGRRAMRLHAVS
jgi:hypothetical protein